MNRFIKHVCEIDKAAATEFFRSHLAGANTKPLYTVSKDQGRYNMIVAKRTIPLPNHQGSDITISMMVEVAWAIVIGRIVESNDVLAPLLTGRNASVQGLKDLIGPTYTQIPVRINIDPQQTIRGLLRSLNEF
jgi:hypothetical protein